MDKQSWTMSEFHLSKKIAASTIPLVFYISTAQYV